MSIADQLFMAREAAGLTVADLAFKARVGETSINEAEKGRLPRTQTLLKLAAALNTTFVIGETK